MFVVVAGVVTMEGTEGVGVVAAGVDATAEGGSVVVVLAGTLGCVGVEFIIVVDLLSLGGSVVVFGTIIGKLPDLACLLRTALPSNCVQAETNHITQEMAITPATTKSFLYLNIFTTSWRL